MMAINEIMSIIRTEEANEFRLVFTYSVIFAAFAIPCAVLLYRHIRRFGIMFLAICLGFLHSMATKPTPVTPQITWSEGLYNTGSSFDTNTWKSITFMWGNSLILSSADTIYFAAKDRGYPELDYFELGSSQVGLHQWSYTFTGQENATNYIYYAFAIGDVHTNGVWIGSILQKMSPGTCGPDKMIFIKSKLYENGKQLTPVKEQ